MKKILFLVLVFSSFLFAEKISKECEKYIDDALRVGENIEAYQNQYNIGMRTTEEFVAELELTLYVIDEEVARKYCKSNSKNMNKFIGDVVKTKNSIKQNIKRLKGN